MPTPQHALARADRSLTRLDELFGLFAEAAPKHRAMAPEDIPKIPRSLLHHQRHMTVTLEQHYDTRVELAVLDQIYQEPFYARKILLTHATPDEDETSVVQYGIMRFDLRRVSAKVRSLILAEELPLGRILIENDVLRRITTHGLLAIEPSPSMRSAVGLSVQPPQSFSFRPPSTVLYGRLATILCNESPAVDLLEVVTGRDCTAGRSS